MHNRECCSYNNNNAFNLCTPTCIAKHLCSSPALIAGVVVSLLVVLILLSLVGGVLAVVVKARRKKTAKVTVQSLSKERLPETEDIKDNVDTCQNVQSQPTQRSSHNKDVHSYATASSIFINPASATASFSANVYESYDYTEVDERRLAASGHGDGRCETREEKWGGGGRRVGTVKCVIAKQTKSALKNVSSNVVKPEELYAQPVKAKKKKMKKSTEKDIEVTSEDVPAPCDDLYAKPDMTKKKDKRSQQHWEQESEERKPVPTAPLPYKMHMEMKQEIDQDEEDIPDEPPPFPVHDGEQYYNTRSGPPTQDGNYDYVVVDRKHK